MIRFKILVICGLKHQCIQSSKLKNRELTMLKIPDLNQMVSRVLLLMMVILLQDKIKILLLEL